MDLEGIDEDIYVICSEGSCLKSQTCRSPYVSNHHLLSVMMVLHNRMPSSSLNSEWFLALLLRVYTAHAWTSIIFSASSNFISTTIVKTSKTPFSPRHVLQLYQTDMSDRSIPYQLILLLFSSWLSTIPGLRTVFTLPISGSRLFVLFVCVYNCR